MPPAKKPAKKTARRKPAASKPPAAKAPAKPAAPAESPAPDPEPESKPPAKPKAKAKVKRSPVAARVLDLLARCSDDSQVRVTVREPAGDGRWKPGKGIQFTAAEVRAAL